MQATAHFKAQWTGNTLQNWSAGHCPNCVINNNGLEATNLVLKKEITQRRLLPVLTYFREAMYWLRDKSLRYDPQNVNYIPFTTKHTITTGNWVESFRWSKDREVQKRIVGEIYVIVTENIDHLTDSRAQRYITMFTDFTFASFDEYTSVSSNVCILRRDGTRQEGYNCTCHQNAKEFFCVHSLGVAILRGTMVPPREARVTLLGRKRKRGRRPQAAPAWQYQPFDMNTPVQHPQQDPALLAGAVANEVQQDIALEQSLIDSNFNLFREFLQIVCQKFNIRSVNSK